MQDPLYNPTPWLSSHYKKPKRDIHYLKNVATDYKILVWWNKVGKKQFFKSYSW